MARRCVWLLFDLSFGGPFPACWSVSWSACFISPLLCPTLISAFESAFMSVNDEPLTMSTPSDTVQSDLTTGPGAFEAADHARRFGGIARLYGAPALAAFERAHV